MSIASTMDKTDRSAHRSSHGRWLSLARLGVTLTTILALTFFLVSLPPYFTHVTTPCSASPCLNDQLLPAEAAKLTAMHISLQLYAVYLIALQSTYVLVTSGVVFLLLWHRSSHGFALFTALTLTTWIYFVVDAPSVLASISSAWSLVDGLFALGNFPLFTLFFFLFPSGRFAARWARWLAVGLIAVTVAFFATAHRQADVSLTAYLLIFIMWFSAIISMQVYRYRRVSTPVERHQTKWVVFGLAVSLLGFIVLLAAQASLPNALLAGLYYPFELLIPLSIGIAILRYRLWDIDLLINRTLVYGSLTTILATLYFSTVIGAQAVTQALTGQAQPNPLILVLSTLLIAALFTPLRQRIQRTIDRRFYRAKYDTARTLEHFAATLRTDTDLPHLTEHLLDMVEETMQPTHVSLWLREPAGAGQHQQADEGAAR